MVRYSKISLFSLVAFCATWVLATVERGVTYESRDLVYGPNNSHWKHVTSQEGLCGNGYSEFTSAIFGSVSLQFTGIAIALDMVRSVNGTKVAIDLDGSRVDQIDTYLDTIDCITPVFQRSGLAYGNHTIVISDLIGLPRGMRFEGFRYITYTEDELAAGSLTGVGTISSAVATSTPLNQAKDGRRRLIAIIVPPTIVGFCLILGCIWAFRRLTYLESRVNVMQEEIASMRPSVKDAHNRVQVLMTAMETQRRQADQEVSTLREALSNTQQRVTALEQSLNNIEKQLNSIQQDDATKTEVTSTQASLETSPSVIHSELDKATCGPEDKVRATEVKPDNFEVSLPELQHTTTNTITNTVRENREIHETIERTIHRSEVIREVVTGTASLLNQMAPGNTPKADLGDLSTLAEDMGNRVARPEEKFVSGDTPSDRGDASSSQLAVASPAIQVVQLQTRVATVERRIAQIVGENRKTRRDLDMVQQIAMGLKTTRVRG